MRNEKTLAHKRYYLHKVVRESFTVNARRREVLIPLKDVDGLNNHKAFKHIKKLQKLGYNIQTSIE